MPAPFAMPVSVTPASPMRICCDAALGSVSVVMIAVAALNQLSSRRSARHAGNPAAMRSTGSGSMMTPVENGRTWPALQLSNRASSAHVWRACAKPSLPVPAFALPVLITSARVDNAGSSVDKCWRVTTTGAAQKRFCVNTPATFAPSASLMTSRSLRPGLRMFASAMPSATPGTGNREAGSGAERFTGMAAGSLKVARDYSVRHRGRPVVCVRGTTLRKPAVAVLVFLAGSARAGIVAPDLLARAHERLGIRRGRVSIRLLERLLVVGMMVLHVPGRLRLLDLLQFRLAAHLHGQQELSDLGVDHVEHQRKKLERFFLVFLGGCFLRIATQMDALPQVVECGQMFSPVGVDALQHDRAFELAHRLRLDLGGLGLVFLVRQLDDARAHLVLVHVGLVGEPLLDRQIELEVGRQRFLKSPDIPLLFQALPRNLLPDESGHDFRADGGDTPRDV